MSAIGFNNVFTDAAPEKTNEELRTIRSNNPAYKKITNTYDVNTLTIKQYKTCDNYLQKQKTKH